MEKRVRSTARPSSSSSAHSAAPALDNFLQVLPPERSFSAASALPNVPRAAAAIRAVSLAKPSRGVIVTETVKKAAYVLSNSCLQLEQLVSDAAESHSAHPSGRSDASVSSRRYAAASSLIATSANSVAQHFRPSNRIFLHGRSRTRGIL
jgi:hypothetical protein